MRRPSLTLADEWRFLPLWVTSLILSLAGVWIPYYLRAAGESVAVDPLRNGSLYVFAFVLVFGAFGALLNDLFNLPDYGLSSAEALVSFGVAALIAILGGTKYGALLVNSTESGIEDSRPVLSVLLALFAGGYALISEYLRNGLRST